MRVDNTADLITRDGATIPADGGVLVGWKPLVNGPKNDAPARPAWTFNGAAATQMVELAPHLVVYSVKATGALAVADPAKAKVATFTRADKAPGRSLPAPNVTKLVLTKHQQRWTERREVTATLASPSPPEAVALVTYAMRDKKQVALSYERIPKAGAKVLSAFADADSCGFLPKGIQPPKVGESVTFAYVDQFGRLGAQGAAVKMVEGVR